MLHKIMKRGIIWSVRNNNQHHQKLTTISSSLANNDNIDDVNKSIYLKNHVELIQLNHGTNNSDSNIYRLRPSYYLLDTIGDITSIEMCNNNISVEGKVSPNLPICNIEWTGYKISAADELYHTIWENAEGNETISLPINVKVVAVNNNAVNSNNSANDWIVDVEIVDHDLYSMNDIILDEEAYDEFCDNIQI